MDFSVSFLLSLPEGNLFLYEINVLVNGLERPNDEA